MPILPIAMTSVFKLFAILLLSKTVLAQPLVEPSRNFPTFEVLAEATPESRKTYFLSLYSVIGERQNAFLDRVLVSSQSIEIRTCFPGIYGFNAYLQNPDHRTRNSCPQDATGAAAFFQNPLNKGIWEKFRAKFLIRCLSVEACGQFLVKNENLIKGLKFWNSTK